MLFLIFMLSLLRCIYLYSFEISFLTSHKIGNVKPSPGFVLQGYILKEQWVVVAAKNCFYIA